MDEICDVLCEVPIFQGIPAHGIQTMLNCFYGTVKTFHQGTLVISAEDRDSTLGIILSGKVTVFESLGPGYQKFVAIKRKYDVFGQALFCNSEISSRKIGVFAAEDCKILLLDYERILSACYLCCFFHMRFLYQLKILAASYQDQ